MLQKNIIRFFAAGLLLLAACSKMDEYKDRFISTGTEVIYAGKVDSLKVRSGKNRVLVTGLFSPDPKVTSCRIYWDTRTDSITLPITITGKDTLNYIIENMSEGRHNFEVVTFDASGNRSVSVTGSGVSYGERYQSGLIDRPIGSAELGTNGNATITWADFDTSSGAKATIQQFTNNSNQTITVTARVSEAVTTLTSYKAGSALLYRTLYLPDTTCIDTFYTSWQSKGVKADVTSIYLSNMGTGFQAGTVSGRWGTLASPWVTNTAAKNKSGTVGGYSTDEGGIICWETWDNTPVVNGIVYQPTNQALPAGNYIVSFDEYSEVQSTSSVYCVAAAGGSGIPVLANLSSSLGYVALYNGANPGATSPSASDTRTFTFTLATPQIVSIGFLGNLLGSGNPGNYFQVKKVRLYSN